jgi:WD40 repeat protein
MEDKKTIKIFISSPSDVKPERLIAQRVVERLDREFSYHFKIEPILWEREPLIATEHFQTMITPPSQSNIVVVILWSKLGTYLPEEEFKGPLSGEQVTGTEWEFEDAYKSYQENKKPDLLLYRKQAEVMASIRDRDALDQLQKQNELVDNFMRKWFVDEESEIFKAASHRFDAPESFEDMLEKHLRGLIRDKLDLSEGEVLQSSIRWHEGSPYRGLESFELKHAPVFFGRTRARNELREALAKQSSKGCAFVLVFGASGSGKSSLVKAGLLPDLTLPGMVEQVGLCRYALMKPSDASGNLFEGLASSLLSETALPELSNLEYSQETLTQLLQKSPDQIVLPIRQGLAKAGEAAQLTPNAKARLTLVVDQLEELFTSEKLTTSDRKLFVSALEALARSGLVWVIGTMRSDFFNHLEQLPELAKLSQGEGRYLLLPPDESEIGQIICQPAREAGIRFEVNDETGLSLDETLRQASGQDSSALPLLEFTLDQLWQTRSDKGVLTYEAYENLGGLEGALGRKAEEVFTRLEKTIQEVFPSVLRTLVTVGQGERSEATARTVPLEHFPEGTPKRKLIDTFLAQDARLLVADSEQGEPKVRVAHEALLSHWLRAARQIDEDRNDLQIRGRLEQANARWRSAKEADKKSLLLAEGLPLSEVENLLQRRKDDLDSDVLAFINESLALVAQRRKEEKEAAQKKLKRTRQLTGVFALLAILAVVGGYFAYKGQIEAKNQVQIAKEERKQALKNQSLFLAEKSQVQTKAGNTLTGMLLALEALPKNLSPNQNRPFVKEAEVALYRAVSNHRSVKILKGVNGFGVLIFDGKRIVTESSYGTIHIWDAATGQELAVLKGHNDYVRQAAYSPDGKRIVTVSRDKTARIWDSTSGQQLAMLNGHNNYVVTHAVFSPDGQSIVTASDDDYTARTWDSTTGQQLAVSNEHYDVVRHAVFSPDGQSIVTASDDYTARIWDAATGQQLAELNGHIDAVTHAAYSPDGKCIVTVSRNKTARIWDSITGQQLAVLNGDENVAFSPDGQRIVTASGKTARIWEAATGKELAVLKGHSDPVKHAAFSPDGQSIVTASDDYTARIWDSTTGQQLAVLKGHNDAVTHAVFSPDGQRIVTASHDGTARIWVSSTENKLVKLTEKKKQNSYDRAVFSTDGKRIVTFGKTLKIWDSTTGQELAIIKEPGTSDGRRRRGRGRGRGVHHVAFSSDGQLIAISARKRFASIWDAKTGQKLAVTRHCTEWQRREYSNTKLQDREVLPCGRKVGHYRDVTHATFSPDNKRLVTASKDNSARVWDSKTGNELAILKGHNDNVTHAVFSPDGQRIVTASDDYTARIWDSTTGQQLAVLKGHNDDVTHAVFSPDGQSIVTASDDIARIWDSTTGQKLVQLEGPINSLSHITFSPDSKRILNTGEVFWEAEIWDAETGQILAKLTGHNDKFSSYFSPDGKIIVTGSKDKTARIWDGITGQELAVLTGHISQVFRVSFNPDGTKIITVSVDGTARIWETETGKELDVLAPVNYADFSADGKRIVTVSNFKTIQTWKVFPLGQELIDYARSILPEDHKELTPEERKRFFLSIN